MTFIDDQQFSVTTDCNNGSGSYTLDGNNLTFGPIATTR